MHDLQRDVVSIPSDFVERICRVQREGELLLARAQFEREPPAVALTVEEHRWAWRPDAPRLLLIAESHVFTTDADLRSSVRCSMLPEAARHTPEAFVRLIYCLGYGESDLLAPRPATANGGTPQFWKIFGRLARTGAPPSSVSADRTTRFWWKINTLQTLQRRGVWLLDASLHAIYAPGGRRLPSDIKRELHRLWWRHYGAELVRSAPGARVWAIGKTVADELRTVGVSMDDWIYQPQAARGATVDMERGWDDLQQIAWNG